MIVTLGWRDGLSALPFAQFRASVIARKMKPEAMLVNSYRKAVALTA
jgi:hypothetical protein